MHVTSSIGENEKFKHFLKNSFDIIVLLDENGMQHYVSESCERILGFKPEELTGIDVIQEMIHPEDQAHTRQGLVDIITKNTNGGAQYRHRHKDGHWVYLEAYGFNQLQNPLIKSVILNVRDITERKAAEQALMESEAQLSELNATKDRFFSIIAHDLKSPFNGILGLSEMLVEQLKEDNFRNALKYSEMVHASARKAVELINDLLKWARAQNGLIEFNPQSFVLGNLLTEIHELMQYPANEKNIHFHYEDTNGIHLYADREMIHTVLRNLISNSIKFTPSGGHIYLSGVETEDAWQISIRDTGVGISEINMNKLFKIEHTHSTMGTEKETGTGLGLLLCKEFVEKHNGRIWAESEPGMGSTFHFTLPKTDKERAG